MNEAQRSIMHKEETERINNAIQAGKKRGLILNAKDVSDGYHTFDELYHHRAVMFAYICNSNTGRAWKSWKHHDGTMFDGMFIVGINTPMGQYSYHYNPEYWDMFVVPELPNAPEYDGHKPEDVKRLWSLL